MRVLVVHHGAMPEPGKSTTGGALRADWHVRALHRLGHEVLTLHREQDGPRGYTGPAHLRDLAQKAQADWILCVAPEDAPALSGVAPLVVDLYAPRILEAAFAGQQEDEARRALLAVDAADEVLFSNPAQRVFWLGILGLAGWDLSRAVGLTVPMVADIDAVPETPRTTKKTRNLPTVIAGGFPWPWQDARQALERAVAHLRGRARVVTYGLPEVAGVESHGIASRREWLAACAGAAVALDRYARHQEREIAVSFRQMDYLAAGLPMISDPWTPLAARIRQSGAGDVDLPLEAALDRLLADATATKAGIAELRRDHSIEAAAEAFFGFEPAPRQRRWSAVRWSNEAAQAILRADADGQLRAAAEEEVHRKRAEVDTLVEQNRSLTDTVAKLSAAVSDVTSFRRETVAVLGSRLTGQTEEAEHLRRELAISQADLAKKQAELDRLMAERDRLGGVLSRLARK